MFDGTDRARVIEWQHKLAPEAPPTGSPAVDRLAAVDVAAHPEAPLGVGCAVLYSLERGTVLSETTVAGVLPVPYVSGLLACREAPLMREALRLLPERPDALLVHGHGYAHPRRFGLASHLGRLMDRPSFGCVGEVLVGEHEPPGPRVGGLTDLWDGEPVGFACRSHAGGRPVYLSPGHRLGRAAIPPLVRPLLDGCGRLPIPLRRADRRAGALLERLRLLASPFRDRGIEVLLVGGALRDLLTGESPRDWDLLAADFSGPVRRALAERLDGNVFPLDEARGMYRVQGEAACVDVTTFPPGGIEADLRRRDFTANAVALDLTEGRWHDPTGGRADLRRRRLHPCRSDSLREDPLRVLRAYRHADRAAFTFTGVLRKRLPDALDDLGSVSRERVVEELLRLAGGSDPAPPFRRAGEDGVFERVDFFRPPAPREVARMAGWRDALRDHRLLEDTVHGGVQLYTALTAARGVLPAENGDAWPFHRRIRTISRATAQELKEAPPPPVLTAGRDALLGRLLGRGLRSGWETDRMSEALARLSRYLLRRRRVEKAIARETDDAARIAGRKDELLPGRLPAIWRELLGPVL